MGRAIEVDKKLDILEREMETLRKRVKLLELQLKEMENKKIIQSEVIHLDKEKPKSKKVTKKKSK